MPKIHKLEQIVEEKVEKTSSNLRWAQFLMKLRLEKIIKYPNSCKDRISYCICVHPKSFHNDATGICSYNNQYCICNGFSSLPFFIKIEITIADRFEHEIKDHSERDSLNWWNEFESWKKLNEESSILHDS